MKDTIIIVTAWWNGDVPCYIYYTASNPKLGGFKPFYAKPLGFTKGFIPWDEFATKLPNIGTFQAEELDDIYAIIQCKYPEHFI